MKLLDSIERLAAHTRGDARFDPRLFAKPTPRFELRNRRVLVSYLFDGLDHGALLAPVLAAIAAKKPKTPIGVLARAETVRFLKTVDLPLRFHTLPDAMLPGAKPKEASRARAALEAALASKKYEVAVDLALDDTLDVRPLLAASGAEIKLGWLRPREKLERIGLDFGAPDTREEATMHWSRALVMPLATLGIERPESDVRFLSRPAAAKKAASFFGADERSPRVLIFPGHPQGHEPSNPELRFAAVGRWARDRRGARIVVAGGPNETAMVRTVKKAIGPEVKGSATKDIHLLRELIATSDAVITNDTGPMHLSFLVGAPTIATFRRASPVVFGPPKNDPSFVVVSAHRELDRPHEPGGDDVWARLVIHHLDRLLSRRARRRRF